MAAKTKTFEARLEQLETLVTRMEEGGMPLSAALKDYEAGIRLVSREDTSTFVSTTAQHFIGPPSFCIYAQPAPRGFPR